MDVVSRTATTWGVEADKLNAKFTSIDSASIVENFAGVKIARTLAKLMSREDLTYGKLQRNLNDDVRIVGLGDSVMAQDWINTAMVEGVSGETDGRNFTGLKDLFPNSNFSVINSGLGGHSAVEFKRILFGSVIPYDPDLVIIYDWHNADLEIWATDAQEYYSSYEEVLLAIRKYTIADIIICTWGIGYHTYTAVAGSPGTRILKQLAAKYGCEFVDVAKYMQEFGLAQTVPFDSTNDITEWVTRGYCPDGDVHPLLPGQQVIAKAVMQSFRPVNDFASDTMFWNLAKSWMNRNQIIEAESVAELYDNRVTYSSYSAFILSGTTHPLASSKRIIQSLSANANNEYIEFKVKGSQIDLLYSQQTDGAAANVLIDGVAPSVLSRCSQWYPDADDLNAWVTSAERDCKPKFINGIWHTSERIVITGLGTVGETATGFNITGDVSGELVANGNTSINHTITNGTDVLYLRADFWSGRANVKGGDKFYIYLYNAQAINLHSMSDWHDSPIPLIKVSETLDENYLLRFCMTSATAFRIDKVTMQDRKGEAITDNVITAIGTGLITEAYDDGLFSITLGEIQRVSILIASDAIYYYYVNRKYKDSVSCLGVSAAYKKVTIASYLENKEHTVRITKSGTGKLYIDGVIVKQPEM